ncbi:MAG: hypothetical protein M0C28_33690 [Candidatus Moduliflexus flocculans]|nr:hypothetical protein [Candidatus Moduliflexus flocculans]
MSLGEALLQVHFPDLAGSSSRPRVNALPSTKSSTCKWECCARSATGNRWTRAASPSRTSGWMRDVAGLPFTLTSAQQNAARRHPRRPRLWQAHEPTCCKAMWVRARPWWRL